jgi:type II secretory pathway component GspD/PulD (secretin)
MKNIKFLSMALGALVATQAFAQDAAKTDAAPATNADANKVETPAATNSTTNAPAARPGEIRVNFRDASLEQVLTYMSEAAGFIINIAPGTSVSGKVTVWSNQSLTKEEAVQVLDKALNQNGLSAIREGRTLTIVSRELAKTYPLKIVPGNDPEKVEPSDEMVTQIIPVQHANAAALIQNLQPLLAEYAQTALTANESGNSLILTATKTDVRRMLEIIHALDTAISSVSSIRVFPLRYADAKELVTAVKELFTPPQTQGNNNNGRGGQFLQQMFGGGGGPGGFGGGGPGGFGGGPGGFGGGGGRGGRGGGAAAGNTSQTAARVVAVADERSNSLIVAAADEMIPTIEKLVKEIDLPVDDVTELRVFQLKNSDPDEIASILQNLFPDDTTQGSNQQVQFRGGGFGGFGGGRGGFGGRGGGAAQGGTSERAKKKGRVIAVSEPRTGSLIVSAASELMPQIEAMIQRIDSSKAGQKKVFVFSIENGDPQQIQEVLRSTFDRSNLSRQQNNNDQSALASRQRTAIQQQGQNQIGSGFGGQGGAARGGQR